MAYIQLSFLPKLIVKQFRPALTICHLSFEHLSWKHRDDILTNSCHIISSLVGTVSNIVCCSDDQRILVKSASLVGGPLSQSCQSYITYHLVSTTWKESLCHFRFIRWSKNIFWSCHQLSIFCHCYNLPTTSVTVRWSDRRWLRQPGTSPSCEKRNPTNSDVCHICLDFS